jgi:hypothetical protein
MKPMKHIKPFSTTTTILNKTVPYIQFILIKIDNDKFKNKYVILNTDFLMTTKKKLYYSYYFEFVNNKWIKNNSKHLTKEYGYIDFNYEYNKKTITIINQSKLLRILAQEAEILIYEDKYNL